MKGIGDHVATFETDKGEMLLTFPTIEGLNAGALFAFDLTKDGQKIDFRKKLWWMNTKYRRQSGADGIGDIGVTKFPQCNGKVTRVGVEGHVGITCAQVPEQEVFMHTNVAQRTFRKFQVGDIVAFDLHFNEKGKAQASAPIWKVFDFEGDLTTDYKEQEKAKIDPLLPKPEKDKIKMGTITGEVTPDGNHTVILTMDHEMIFIDNEVLEKYGLSEGKDIAFQLWIDNDGHSLVDAEFPVWLLGANFKEDQEPCFGDFVGEIITVSATGNGFISSPDNRKVYERDCFVHYSVMKICGLSQGDIVAFNVHMSENGTPQASAPLWIMCIDPEKRKEKQERNAAMVAAATGVLNTNANNLEKTRSAPYCAGAISAPGDAISKKENGQKGNGKSKKNRSSNYNMNNYNGDNNFSNNYVIMQAPIGMPQLQQMPTGVQA